jgi:hypothetical protein
MKLINHSYCAGEFTDALSSRCSESLWVQSMMNHSTNVHIKIKDTLVRQL